MLKLLLIILLLSAFPINANALDWVAIDVSDEGRTYIDVDSIRKDDEYVYVWVLLDLSDVINYYLKINKFYAEPINTFLKIDLGDIKNIKKFTKLTNFI